MIALNAAHVSANARLKQSAYDVLNGGVIYAWKRRDRTVWNGACSGACSGKRRTQRAARRNRRGAVGILRLSQMR